MRIPLFALGIIAGSSLIVIAQPNGDSQVRAQAGKSEIVITTQARFAGAIESLTWDGMEFIDHTDHGRELQSACSFDNSPTAGPETFNPTEAGSRDDWGGPVSTSRLLKIMSAGNHLQTQTAMAFWLKPGETSEGKLARNTNSVSNYILSKDVRIGFRSWPQALDYKVTFTVPKDAHHSSAQFEALTGYLPPQFERFWQFNSQIGKLEPLGEGPGGTSHPVVLATADGLHATGIYAPAQNQSADGPRYGWWNFKDQHVVKWNCVFRVHDSTGIRSGDYSYRMLVPIGTLQDVEAMLRDWSKLPLSSPRTSR